MSARSPSTPPAPPTGPGPVVARPIVTPLHRDVAARLLSTFRPRTDLYAQRFDTPGQVAGINAWAARNGAKPWAVGEWKPVRRGGENVPLTVDLLAEHVAGRLTLGVYPLHDDKTCNSISVDFDNHRGNVTVIRDPRDDLDACVNVCLRLGLRFLANHSRGGKGHWLHVLPPPGTLARESRAVMHAILRDARVKHVRDGGTFDALFPKQDEVFRREGAVLTPGNLFCVPVCGRWLRAENPGTHFIGTDPGDLAAQLKHLAEY